MEAIHSTGSFPLTGHKNKITFAGRPRRGVPPTDSYPPRSPPQPVCGNKGKHSRSALRVRAADVDVIGIGQGLAPAFTRSHSNDVLNRVDEDDAISLLARARSFHKRCNRRFNIAFAEYDIELELGEHVFVPVGILRGVFLASLPATTADLEHVHSNDPYGRKRFPYAFQRLFPDDCLDLSKHSELLSR